MEDYRLEQSGQEVQDILNGAAMQSDLTAETERATEAEQTLQGNIDIEERDRKAADLTLQGNIDAEELRAKAAEKQNADDIDALEEKVPSGASSSNKLATESYVDDSVATATATFRGTYNLVSDLHLTVDATEQQIATALALAISTADNNDYCFILVPTSSETPTEIKEIDRYKFNGTAWSFEYKLNNSGFTAAQWAAINSGITSGDVTKLAALPTNAQLTTLLAGKQDVLTFDNVPTESSNHPVKSGGVYSAIDDEKTARETADSSLSSAIEAILLLIPSAATSLNKLADKAFVNSSIATASATFRGTYNLVTDLSLTVSATHAQIATALAGAVSDEDNNDYAFVQIPTSDATPTQIAKTERYKYNGTAWEYEYDLNNSGYTAAQWAAINSGITEALVTKLSALPTNTELTSALGVLTSSITTINQKIPSAASQANQLVDTAAMESYIVQVLDVLTASFNVTSTDGHVTVSISQVDGKITSVAVSTSDIASAASLSLVEGRVTTAEGNISTNTQDIAFLREAYNTIAGQSDIVVVDGALPSSGQQQNVIYRQPDPDHTPPQFYSDYMWNGTAWVLMATYNNAIDDVPTAGSNNLVKSGGVEKITSGIQQDVDDIFSLSDKGLPPYVRQITLDGLTSNENLRVFFFAGNAFTFQVFQNNNLISYCSIPKTQDDNYYILNTVTGSLLEYQSSGVTGSIILTYRFIPKYLGNKYFNITYPHNESLFSNIIHNVLENADIKARKSFWKIPKKNYNSNHAIANLVVREIYLNKPSGSQLDENNIVLGNIRKGYNGAYRVVFYVGDDSGTTPYDNILIFESDAQNATGVKILKASSERLEGYIVIDWDLLEDGANLIVSISTRYLIDWSTVSDIANSPSLYNYLYIVTKLNTPDISWVDDDFLGVEKITDICDNVGCKCDFAVIPQVSGGTGEYPTDYVFDFDPSTLQKIASVENAGYHIENHPVHKGWYKSQSAGSYQGRAYTEYLLVSGLRLFKKSDVLNSKCVIYPGDSGSRQEVTDMCRSHLEYGIKSDGKYNNGVVDPMKLERLFIQLSSTKTKTYYKNIILEAYNKGAWLIIGTHSWEFTESDVTDETSMTTANLQEIVSYANNLSNIKPVSEIYRKRKQMFDLYKIV